MPLAYEVTYDLPRELYPGGYEGFEHYLILTEEVCHDYRSPPDFRRMYQDGLQRIHDFPYARLKHGLDHMDGPIMFDYCLRSLSLCEVPPDPSGGTRHILENLAGLSTGALAQRNPPSIENYSESLRIRSLAFYSHLNFWAHWLVPDGGSLYPIRDSHVMHNAAFAANACVESGFVPRIALRVAAWLATSKARFGIDVRELSKFQGFHHLYAAHEAYLARLRSTEAERLLRISETPHHYRCANEGCDIQAFNKAAFRRCAGRCSPETKPHYCSQFCQRRHWIIHREFCNNPRSAGYAKVVDDDGDADWIDEATFHGPQGRDIDSEYWERCWPIWSEREGPEIFIDIPNISRYRKGEIMRIRTKTLSPQCLKAYKLLWTITKMEAALGAINESLIDPPENMGFPKSSR
ncbi:hypothetical protein C8Q78DRAFT_1066691 [Trametes maxima]|nr:hypothetical protein C8Q78DRAFT_1066691 [Trametes maxima]